MVRTTERRREVFVADLLSFARVPLAALLWVSPFDARWTLSILIAAGATDVLDGWTARRARRRWKSHGEAFAPGRGAFIDGLADKVFVVSAVAVVAVILRPPWWSLVMLALREIVFVPIMLAYALAPRAERERVDFTAGVPGKVATFAQVAALALGLARNGLFAEAALVAGTLGALAAIYYVVRVTSEPRGAHA